MAAPEFSAFTVKGNGLLNRIITPILVTEAFDHSKPPPPSLKKLETHALWDTGATSSVITDTTAKSLGLAPIGLSTINHAGGVSQANKYVVAFLLPNHVGVAGVMVSECPDVSHNFGVIIGMDIIMRGDFSVTNCDGKSCISFRIPSKQRIDYVLESNKIKFRNVSRNAPCPCGKTDGNGRRLKFKQCCIHLTEA